MKIKYFVGIAALLCIVGWSPFSFLFSDNDATPGTQEWLNNEIHSINSQASNIDQHVLQLSLKAYLKARDEGLDDKQILTIIDYTKSSAEPRLWVVDLKRNKVLFNTWVAHGKNSGMLVPNSFSNSAGSLQSSVGLYSTEDPYMGHNGYSLRLKGLEHGINDNAYNRSIVVHGAWYVGPEVARERGVIGRSWGCPAVSEKVAKPLIEAIKDRTLVFIYGNDRKWLHHSNFLA